jgi:hypothetical protein
MEPAYISIKEAARQANRSRSTIKRWLKECRDLIDAGQEPLFSFIDPKDGRHGRVDIHRESFLAFRASEHRTRRTLPGSAGPKQERRCRFDLLTPSHRPQHQALPNDMRPVVAPFACLDLLSPAIGHDHVLLHISGGGARWPMSGGFWRC